MTFTIDNQASILLVNCKKIK